MTKAALKNLCTEIARKRREVMRLQEDLRAMLDHLAVIEARAESADGKRYSTAEVQDALGLSRSDPLANQGQTKLRLKRRVCDSRPLIRSP